MSSMATNTTSDDHGQLTWWNIVRPIISLVVPWKGCHPFLSSLFSPSTCTVTGTIICPVSCAKVRLCMQENSKSFPMLLLDLPLQTSDFAALVQRGVNRIVLESPGDLNESDGPLLSLPWWVMYCNGQKMGVALKKEVTGKDTWLLEMMRTVSAGAGILPDEGSGGYKYLRGQFERAVGSDDSEAYHLIDPSGCFGQELSVFFLRV